jgi:hypothetical protein
VGEIQENPSEESMITSFLGTTDRDFDAIWAAYYGGVAHVYTTLASIKDSPFGEGTVKVWETAAYYNARRSAHCAIHVLDYESQLRLHYHE